MAQCRGPTGPGVEGLEENDHDWGGTGSEWGGHCLTSFWPVPFKTRLKQDSTVSGEQLKLWPFLVPILKMDNAPMGRCKRVLTHGRTAGSAPPQRVADYPVPQGGR